MVLSEPVAPFSLVQQVEHKTLLAQDEITIEVMPLANPSNAQYYTSQDVNYFNEQKANADNHLSFLYNNFYHEFIMFMNRYGGIENASTNMALESTGFPEVPVAGAERSDYIPPPTHPQNQIPHQK